MTTTINRRLCVFAGVALAFMSGCAGIEQGKPSRPWIGPDYWANPLQDWALNQGRIECVVSGGDRNLVSLRHEFLDEPGNIDVSVEIGALDDTELTEGWVGFSIGKRGEFSDYRDSAVRGLGFPAGMTTDGRLFVGDLRASSEPIPPPFDNIRLVLFAKARGSLYDVTLTAFDKDGQKLATAGRARISSEWMHGGIALVCSNGPIAEVGNTRPAIDDGNWGNRPGTNRGGNVRFWFKNWRIAGSKLVEYDDRGYGPIMFNQYTLSRKILKMTAQMAPVSHQDGKEVVLQTQSDTGEWQDIATAEIDRLSRTAAFRLENWNPDLAVPYRLAYEMRDQDGQTQTYHYEGTIRREPWDKDEVVVAGFTGNNDLGFPNNDIMKQLRHHDPDVLFFSGDQLYEGVGGYGAQRSPLEPAILDYLRKWYIFGWTYRELLRDRPAVSITDDHDVYHGNIWGAGGKAVPEGTTGAEAQDAGGYKQPPEWVNMVQHTQTSHLPDPFDPTPVLQNIGVYYTDMTYAGISFAILEDRKFKSAPKTLLPQAGIHNGWAQNPDFDAKKDSDAPDAVLLGERQLNFLDHWAADWSDRTWMKVVLSQTIFANVATLPRTDATHDRIVPQLRILEKGEYAPDDIPVADMDSNGWPPAGRNRALRVMRKAFAFNIAGDQHLGSTIQYGIDDWGDAGFAFCVPAVSNVWPRRWYPAQKSPKPLTGQPAYTGDYEDGFGNKITVHAVSNPVFTGLEPARLYDRATGYGIVRFNRKTRDITIECWPRLADPAKDDSQQYDGWPIKINQMDNFGKNAQLFLPTLVFSKVEDPIVQLIDESNDEIVYTIRARGNRFRPPVLSSGSYAIKLWSSETAEPQTYSQLSPGGVGVQKEIVIE